ncbi:HlyD family efflux transporter periplasmic adaptor subunit [candidate division WWE3 bacterium]|nr:HlyD family efflux transporter periplasmic adaptor subunit [candidate division WWE3 bacterium]
MKKILIWLIIIAGLIGGGVYYYMSRPKPVTTYDFGTVELGSIVKTVSESGEAFISDQYPINATITGVIDELFIKNGDSVTAGQKLLTIKSTATDDDRKAAETTLLSAQSNLNLAEQNKYNYQIQLEQAKKDLRNAEEAIVQMNNHLGDNKINPATGKQYTQLEIDNIYATRDVAKLNKTTAEQRYKDADLSIKAAQGSVSNAETNLNKLKAATINAPVGGQISNLTVGRGDYVSATTTAISAVGSASTPLLYILPSTDILIKAQYNEVDAALITPGQNATITVDALANEEFAGHVDRIDTIGTKTQGVVSYTVYLKLNAEDKRIRPSMTTVVEIEVARKDQALTVATSAVRPYQNGLALMQLQEDGTITYLPIKTGITDGSKTEIISGVTQGTKIITKVNEPETNGGGLIARPSTN